MKFASFSPNAATDVTLWKNLLLEFVPKRGELNDRDSEAYECCAKFLDQQGDHGFVGSNFRSTTPGESSYEKKPYDQYMMFAREVAGLIKEAENIDACTFDAIHNRLNQRRRLEGYPEVGAFTGAIAGLIEDMTLLKGVYNFLPRRMWVIHKIKDLGLGEDPRVQFQQLGLFEEDDSTAPRGVSKPFRGEVPTADCLCDVLGVEIDWTTSLADHLNLTSQSVS